MDLPAATPIDRFHPAPAVRRVALLFNAGKVYDREIIAGIGDYLTRTRVPWDVFLEEDFHFRLDGIEAWDGDGVIADFDDPAVAETLGRLALPVVAVGSSYADPTAYPAGIPYVATDNAALVRAAHDHLVAAGLTRFAFYSLPPAPGNRWAQERERAFLALTHEGESAPDGNPGGASAPAVYRGVATTASTWNAATRQLVAWLRSLPRPVGVIAATDARARQLLQACIVGGITVPDEVAIIGIDNDPLARHLMRTGLSSVGQGTEAMGHAAAQLLHQMIGGTHPEGVRLHVNPGGVRMVIGPSGVHARASTARTAPHSPPVMRALHFIRQYACQGIKTAQVAAEVGLSRSSLETVFRRELQRTVHHEILEARLAAAQALLREGTRGGAAIAQRAGFSSVQYLHAVFRRELGCTPREWLAREAGPAMASSEKAL